MLRLYGYAIVRISIVSSTSLATHAVLQLSWIWRSKMAKKKRSPHAVIQERYHNKKLETHKKICIWVPKHRVGSFLKSVDRLRQKF